MLINQTLPGLYNGVSGQAPELRLDTQVEEMINCYPSVVTGVGKRPPLEYMANNTSLTEDVFVHTYDRGDDLEKYIIAIDGGSWYTFDLDGTPINSGTDVYLTTGTTPAKEAFALTTIGDITYIVNKTKTVEMDTTLGSEVETTYWTLGCSNYTLVGEYDGGDFEVFNTEGTIEVTVNVDGTPYIKTLGINTSLETADAQYNTEVEVLIAEALADIVIAIEDINHSGSKGLASDGSHTITLGVAWVDVVHGTEGTTSYSIIEIEPGAWESQFFYWVKRSAGAATGDNALLRHTYYIYKNGASLTEAIHHDSTAAASLLATAIGGIARGSVVMNVAESNEAYTGSDSWGDQASESWQGRVKKLQDLPNNLGFEGSVIQITGDDKSNFDEYYVQYIEGVYKETVKPNLYNTIDASTMPHILARGQDAAGDIKFYFDVINDSTEIPLEDEYGNILNTSSWGMRTAGDELSASEPSFVGNTITDVFFFKNRLGLISGENIVMSEVGEYYNFFPTTVTDVLDSDPIDVAVDSSQVVALRYAIPFNKELLLFGDKAQFILSGAETLTPKDVSIQQSTAFDTNRFIKPVGLGPNVYFTINKEETTQVREYFVVPDTAANDAANITAHCPQYVPTGMKVMAGSSKYDMLFMATGSDNIIYVYSFYWQGEEKAQSAWHKWVMPENVINMAMVDSTLAVMTVDEGVMKLHHIVLEPTSLTQYSDGVVPYEASIELSKWGISTGNAGVDTLSGGLKFKAVRVANTNGGPYTLVVENKRRVGSVDYYNTKSLDDKKFMVQGNTDDVILSLKDSGSTSFNITSLNYEGLYTNNSKGI